VSSKCCDIAHEISSFDRTVSRAEEVWTRLLGMSGCSLVLGSETQELLRCCAVPVEEVC